MKGKRLTALLLALFMIMLVFGPLFVLKGNLKAENKVLYALNTVINMTAYGDEAEDALKVANNRLYDIDRQFSAYNELSQVALINDKAGIAPVKVSDDVYYVIENALKMSEMTDGAFDITVKPLVDLWNVSQGGYVPDDSEIEKAKSAVGYKNVVLDPAMRSVYLTNKDTKIDLGAIAKGYAGDEARRILEESGAKSAVLDLGGNVVLKGAKPSLLGVGKNWKVGIKKPFGEMGEYFAVAECSDTSLVTSGAYERYFEKDGKMYHHIIDPKTGYPAESDVLSVTIIGENSMIADALSTAVFVMGREKGLKLIEKMSGFDAIIVDKDKNVYKTDVNVQICDSEYKNIR